VSDRISISMKRKYLGCFFILFVICFSFLLHGCSKSPNELFLKNANELIGEIGGAQVSAIKFSGNSVDSLVVDVDERFIDNDSSIALGIIKKVYDLIQSYPDVDFWDVRVKANLSDGVLAYVYIWPLPDGSSDKFGKWMYEDGSPTDQPVYYSFDDAREIDLVAERMKLREENTHYYSNGNYECGVDFEPGTYDITATQGNGNVYSSNAYSGGINAIMGVDDDGFYEKEYKNISFEDGDTLTVEGLTIRLSIVIK